MEFSTSSGVSAWPNPQPDQRSEVQFIPASSTSGSLPCGNTYGIPPRTPHDVSSSLSCGNTSALDRAVTQPGNEVLLRDEGNSNNRDREQHRCRTSPVRYSWNANRNTKIPAVRMPGPISGIITRLSIPILVQPSIIAASSSSRGISAKKLRNNQIVNGWLMATSAIASAKVVS